MGGYGKGRAGVIRRFVENGIVRAIQRKVLDKQNAADLVKRPMKTKTNKPAPDKAQVAAFRKAARELGCDESEERFQEALRTIAKQKTYHHMEKKRPRLK
jgi:hypothetical protein